MKPTRIPAMVWLAALFAVPAFAQGPLMPPGPPAATMKTLEQIEPRTPIAVAPFSITQPGSYYLTADLVCTLPGTNAITVAADDVMIDLMGFSVRLRASPPGGSGIFQGNAHGGLTVRNGTVEGWGNTGEAGVRAMGEGNRVERINARRNFNGLALGERAQVEDCTARNNLNNGIDLGHGGLVCASIAAGNAVHGISVMDGSVVENCVARDNGHDGIAAATGCLVRGSTASGNAQDGILGAMACRILDCIADRNGEDGIEVIAEGTVLHCTSRWNGQTGIHVIGSRNTIDGNHVVGNGTNTSYGASRAGILVNAFVPNNIVIRNWVSNNPINDFNIPGGNQVGTVVPTSPGAPPVLGSAGGGFGATDPFSNVVH